MQSISGSVMPYKSIFLPKNPWCIAALISFTFTIHFYTTEASLRQARAIEMQRRTAGGGSPQDTCCLTFFKGFVSTSRHLCSFFFLTFLLCKRVKNLPSSFHSILYPLCFLLDNIWRSHYMRTKWRNGNKHFNKILYQAEICTVGFGEFWCYRVYFTASHNEQYQVWTWRRWLLLYIFSVDFFKTVTEIRWHPDTLSLSLAKWQIFCFVNQTLI